MSIEQSDVVDLIGIGDDTLGVALIISDHLDWSDEGAHLLLLQNKINAYLRFVESGEIYESYPQAKCRKIIIEVVGKYDLSNLADKLFEQAKRIVEDAGFGLRFVKK
jgi:hypothetical protein